MMILILLIGAHFLFDYALQGDFMSRAKNSANPIPGVPWYQPLIAHAFIHGAAVAVITGIWWLCLIEAVIHGTTDDLKCRGRLSFNQDQYIHLICKLAWFTLGWSMMQ